MNSVQVEVRREAFLSALRRLQQHHNQAITAAQYAPDSHLLSSVHFSPFTLPLSSSAHASPQDLPILQVAASAHRFKPAKIVVPPPSKKSCRAPATHDCRPSAPPDARPAGVDHSHAVVADGSGASAPHPTSFGVDAATERVRIRSGGAQPPLAHTLRHLPPPAAHAHAHVRSSARAAHAHGLSNTVPENLSSLGTTGVNSLRTALVLGSGSGTVTLTRSRVSRDVSTPASASVAPPSTSAALSTPTLSRPLPPSLPTTASVSLASGTPPSIPPAFSLSALNRYLAADELEKSERMLSATPTPQQQQQSAHCVAESATAQFEAAESAPPCVVSAASANVRTKLTAEKLRQHRLSLENQKLEGAKRKAHLEAYNGRVREENATKRLGQQQVPPNPPQRPHQNLALSVDSLDSEATSTFLRRRGRSVPKREASNAANLKSGDFELHSAFPSVGRSRSSDVTRRPDEVINVADKENEGVGGNVPSVALTDHGAGRSESGTRSALEPSPANSAAFVSPVASVAFVAAASETAEVLSTSALTSAIESYGLPAAFDSLSSAPAVPSSPAPSALDICTPDREQREHDKQSSSRWGVGPGTEHGVSVTEVAEATVRKLRSSPSQSPSALHAELSDESQVAAAGHAHARLSAASRPRRIGTGGKGAAAALSQKPQQRTMQRRVNLAKSSSPASSSASVPSSALVPVPAPVSVSVHSPAPVCSVPLAPAVPLTPTSSIGAVVVAATDHGTLPSDAAALDLANLDTLFGSSANDCTETKKTRQSNPDVKSFMKKKRIGDRKRAADAKKACADARFRRQEILKNLEANFYPKPSKLHAPLPTATVSAVEQPDLTSTPTSTPTPAVATLSVTDTVAPLPLQAVGPATAAATSPHARTQRATKRKRPARRAWVDVGVSAGAGCYIGDHSPADLSSSSDEEPSAPESYSPEERGRNRDSDSGSGSDGDFGILYGVGLGLGLTSPATPRSKATLTVVGAPHSHADPSAFSTSRSPSNATDRTKRSPLSVNAVGGGAGPVLVKSPKMKQLGATVTVSSPSARKSAASRSLLSSLSLSSSAHLKAQAHPSHSHSAHARAPFAGSLTGGPRYPPHSVAKALFPGVRSPMRPMPTGPTSLSAATSSGTPATHRPYAAGRGSPIPTVGSVGAALAIAPSALLCNLFSKMNSLQRLLSERHCVSGITSAIATPTPANTAAIPRAPLQAVSSSRAISPSQRSPVDGLTVPLASQRSAHQQTADFPAASVPALASFLDAQVSQPQQRVLEEVRLMREAVESLRLSLRQPTAVASLSSSPASVQTNDATPALTPARSARAYVAPAPELTVEALAATKGEVAEAVDTAAVGYAEDMNVMAVEMTSFGYDTAFVENDGAEADEESAVNLDGLPSPHVDPRAALQRVPALRSPTFAVASAAWAPAQPQPRPLTLFKSDLEPLEPYVPSVLSSPSFRARRDETLRNAVSAINTAFTVDPMSRSSGTADAYALAHAHTHAYSVSAETTALSWPKPMITGPDPVSSPSEIVDVAVTTAAAAQPSMMPSRTVTAAVANAVAAIRGPVGILAAAIVNASKRRHADLCDSHVADVSSAGPPAMLVDSDRAHCLPLFDDGGEGDEDQLTLLEAHALKLAAINRQKLLHAQAQTQLEHLSSEPGSGVDDGDGDGEPCSEPAKSQALPESDRPKQTETVRVRTYSSSAFHFGFENVDAPKSPDPTPVAVDASATHSKAEVRTERERRNLGVAVTPDMFPPLSPQVIPTLQPRAGHAVGGSSTSEPYLAARPPMALPPTPVMVAGGCIVLHPHSPLSSLDPSSLSHSSQFSPPAFNRGGTEDHVPPSPLSDLTLQLPLPLDSFRLSGDVAENEIKDAPKPSLAADGTQMHALRLSPSSLSRRLVAEMQTLGALEQSQQQLLSLEQARALALVERETALLANLLQRQKMDVEAALSQQQLEQQRREASLVAHERNRLELQTKSNQRENATQTGVVEEEPQETPRALPEVEQEVEHRHVAEWAAQMQVQAHVDAQSEAQAKFRQELQEKERELEASRRRAEMEDERRRIVAEMEIRKEQEVRSLSEKIAEAHIKQLERITQGLLPLLQSPGPAPVSTSTASVPIAVASSFAPSLMDRPFHSTRPVASTAQTRAQNSDVEYAEDFERGSTVSDISFTNVVPFAAPIGKHPTLASVPAVAPSLVQVRNTETEIDEEMASASIVAGDVSVQTDVDVEDRATELPPSVDELMEEIQEDLSQVEAGLAPVPTPSAISVTELRLLPLRSVTASDATTHEYGFHYDSDFTDAEPQRPQPLSPVPPPSAAHAVLGVGVGAAAATSVLPLSVLASAAASPIHVAVPAIAAAPTPANALVDAEASGLGLDSDTAREHGAARDALVLERREQELQRRTLLQVQWLARLRDGLDPPSSSKLPSKFQNLSAQEYENERIKLRLVYEAEKADIDKARAALRAQQSKKRLVLQLNEMALTRSRHQSAALEAKLGYVSATASTTAVVAHPTTDADVEDPRALSLPAFMYGPQLEMRLTPVEAEVSEVDAPSVISLPSVHDSVELSARPKSVEGGTPIPITGPARPHLVLPSRPSAAQIGPPSSDLEIEEDILFDDRDRSAAPHTSAPIQGTPVTAAAGPVKASPVENTSARPVSVSGSRGADGDAESLYSALRITPNDRELPVSSRLQVLSASAAAPAPAPAASAAKLPPLSSAASPLRLAPPLASVLSADSLRSGELSHSRMSSQASFASFRSDDNDVVEETSAPRARATKEVAVEVEEEAEAGAYVDVEEDFHEEEKAVTEALGAERSGADSNAVSVPLGAPVRAVDELLPTSAALGLAPAGTGNVVSPAPLPERTASVAAQPSPYAFDHAASVYTDDNYSAAFESEADLSQIPIIPRAVSVPSVQPAPVPARVPEIPAPRATISTAAATDHPHSGDALSVSVAESIESEPDIKTEFDVAELELEPTPLFGGPLERPPSSSSSVPLPLRTSADAYCATFNSGVDVELSEAAAAGAALNPPMPLLARLAPLPQLIAAPPLLSSPVPTGVRASASPLLGTAAVVVRDRHSEPERLGPLVAVADVGRVGSGGEDHVGKPRVPSRSPALPHAPVDAADGGAATQALLALSAAASSAAGATAPTPTGSAQRRAVPREQLAETLTDLLLADLAKGLREDVRKHRVARSGPPPPLPAEETGEPAVAATATATTRAADPVRVPTQQPSLPTPPAVTVTAAEPLSLLCDIPPLSPVSLIDSSDVSVLIAPSPSNRSVSDGHAENSAAARRLSSPSALRTRRLLAAHLASFAEHHLQSLLADELLFATRPDGSLALAPSSPPSADALRRRVQRQSAQSNAHTVADVFAQSLAADAVREVEWVLAHRAARTTSPSPPRPPLPSSAISSPSAPAPAGSVADSPPAVALYRSGSHSMPVSLATLAPVSLQKLGLGGAGSSVPSPSPITSATPPLPALPVSSASPRTPSAAALLGVAASFSPSGSQSPASSSAASVALSASLSAPSSPLPSSPTGKHRYAISPGAADELPPPVHPSPSAHLHSLPLAHPHLHSNLHSLPSSLSLPLVSSIDGDASFASSSSGSTSVDTTSLTPIPSLPVQEWVFSELQMQMELRLQEVQRSSQIPPNLNPSTVSLLGIESFDLDPVIPADAQVNASPGFIRDYVVTILSSFAADVDSGGSVSGVGARLPSSEPLPLTWFLTRILQSYAERSASHAGTDIASLAVVVPHDPIVPTEVFIAQEKRREVGENQQIFNKLVFDMLNETLSRFRVECYRACIPVEPWLGKGYKASARARAHSRQLRQVLRQQQLLSQLGSGSQLQSRMVPSFKLWTPPTAGMVVECVLRSFLASPPRPPLVSPSLAHQALQAQLQVTVAATAHEGAGAMTVMGEGESSDGTSALVPMVMVPSPPALPTLMNAAMAREQMEFDIVENILSAESRSGAGGPSLVSAADAFTTYSGCMPLHDDDSEWSDYDEEECGVRFEVADSIALDLLGELVLEIIRIQELRDSRLRARHTTADRLSDMHSLAAPTL